MNYQKQAIDIITSRDFCDYDRQNILVEIVKSNPSVLVKACRKLDISASSWEQEAIDMYRSGNRVTAIKFCREKTGLGLKEAKDAVEKLMGIS